MAERLAFEDLPGTARISKIARSEGGRQFRAIQLGANRLALVDAEGKGEYEIIVEGGDGATTTIAFLGGITDAIGDAIMAVVKLMTCKLETTTTVTTKPNGVVDKIVTTTKCAD